MGGINLSRRALLFGRPRSVPTSPLPPWARAKSFFDECTRCGECAKACPEGVIAKGDGGFPRMDFTLAGCTFCGACAESCPEAVFQSRECSPWNIRAVIEPNCLARRGIHCQSCADACPDMALRFRPALGTCPQPFVTDACTGCGACVSACPGTAIRVAEGADA